MDKKEALLKKINEIGLAKLVIMALAGILLIVLSVPTQKKGTITDPKEMSTSVIQEKVDTQEEYRESLEKQLSGALTDVAGIGKTKVMITLKSSGEKVLNKDDQNSEEQVEEKDSTGGTRNSNSSQKEEETILVSDGSGSSGPYVTKEMQPEIAGVLVIAEGGDSVQTINDITEACEVLFSLPVHKIKVMKMK